MKNLQTLLLGLLLFWIVPLTADAQRYPRQRALKDVLQARSIALTNTVMPVIVGIGSTLIFKNKTMRTVGATLAIYGLVAGPSAGNFYAEDYTRGVLGVAARLGAGYMLQDATRELLGKNASDAVGWDGKDVSLTDTHNLIGTGIFLGSMVYNIISAKASVNAFNTKSRYSFRVDPEMHEGDITPMFTARVNF